jgi:hypothetical protein
MRENKRMSVQIENDRWKVSVDDFAARIQIPDLEGYFFKWIPKGRQLVIEPGSRAIVIDHGVMIGEVPAGAYTLESFTERLEFWQERQVTVILTRCEETVFQLVLKDLPAAEGLCGSLEILWALQLADPVPFLENLFGARETLSRTELEKHLRPLVTQGLYAACGRTSIDQLVSPEIGSLLSEQLDSYLSVRLQRYGLKFVGLQSARMECPELARHQERAGKNWLAARETQLLRAARQVGDERLQERLDLVQERVPVRRALMDALLSDKFAKIESAEEFRKQVEAIDKDRLLRKEEKDNLVAGYMARQQDRDAAREHALAVLEIDRERELGELKSQIDYAVQEKSLTQEIELTRLNQTKESLVWRQELEREREAAVHHRQLRQDKVQSHWNEVLQARELKRDDSWKELAHRRRMEDVETELALVRTDRARRVSLLESETKTRLAAEQLQFEQQRAVWELDLREKKSASQLERLARIQEMNARFAERQQRTRLDLENLREDAAHRRELDRMQAMQSVSAEVLIVTAKTENASLLADLKKHEASQATARSQQELAQFQQLNEERLQMYERMNETERAKADAIAESYKLSMQMRSGRKSPDPAESRPVSQMAASPPPVPPAIWYAAFNGQQAGPFTQHQIREYVVTGQVAPTTLVWRQGLAGWSPAQQVPDLASLWLKPDAPPPLPPVLPPPLG